jgi:hypothetical protein
MTAGILLDTTVLLAEIRDPHQVVHVLCPRRGAERRIETAMGPSSARIVECSFTGAIVSPLQHIKRSPSVLK